MSPTLHFLALFTFAVIGVNSQNDATSIPVDSPDEFGIELNSLLAEIQDVLDEGPSIGPSGAPVSTFDIFDPYSPDGAPEEAPYEVVIMGYDDSPGDAPMSDDEIFQMMQDQYKDQLLTDDAESPMDGPSEAPVQLEPTFDSVSDSEAAFDSVESPEGLLDAPEGLLDAPEGLLDSTEGLLNIIVEGGDDD